MILESRKSVFQPPNVANISITAGVAPVFWGSSGNGIDEIPWPISQAIRPHETWRLRLFAQLSSQSASGVSIESAAIVVVPFVGTAYFVGQQALIAPALAQGVTALADGMPLSATVELPTDRYFTLFPRGSSLGVLIATELNNTTSGAVLVSLNSIRIEIDYTLSDSQEDYV